MPSFFNDVNNDIYSENATEYCEISSYIGQKKGGGFENFCGLLRIYEL